LRIWWGEEGESPVNEESESEVEPVVKSESEDESPVKEESEPECDLFGNCESEDERQSDFTEPCTAAPEPATGDWSTSVHFKYFADASVNYY
jgi:hypothetical protein